MNCELIELLPLIIAKAQPIWVNERL